MEINRKPEANSRVRLLTRFAYAAAAIFAGMGLGMLLAASDEIPPLQQPDALFGLTTRMVLVIAGVMHLILSGYLFASRDLMNQGLVALWAGSSHLVYGVGTISVLKVATPLPVVVAVGWRIGLSSRMTDIVWKLSIAYLVMGSLLLLTLEWRRLKRLEAERYLEHWRVQREHGLTPPRASEKTPGKES